MNEDITIDLKDLLYRVLLRWRIILIFCILGTLLANGYGIYKDFKAKKAAESVNTQEEREGSKAAAEALRASLSAKEAKEADASLAMYNMAVDRLVNFGIYKEESVFYNLNCQKVPMVTLQYQLDSPAAGDGAGKDYSQDAAGMLIAAVKDEELIASLSASLGLEGSYVDELILPGYYMAGEEEHIGNIVEIKALGKDKAMCDTIADALEKKAESLKDLISTDFGGCRLRLTSRTFTEGFSEEIRDRQYKVTNDAYLSRTALNTLITNLTEGQKKYISAVVEDDILYGDEESVEDAQEETRAVPAVSYVHKKLIILGFVGFGFLVCFIIFMGYVLSPVVRVRDNITDGFSQKVLATVWSEKQYKGIDKWITGLFYGRESSYGYKKRIEMLCASLQLMMKKNDMNELYLTGASDRNKELIGDIIKGLGKEVKATSGESVVYDESSLEALSASPAVVFVETAGDSRYDEISKELEAAEQSGVKVLGFVLLV